MTMPNVVPARAPIEVTGPLGAVRFPDLCVVCAAPPAGDVLVEKMFRHTPSEGSAWYEFGAVRAPACDECLARHRSEVRPIDSSVRRALQLRWAARVLPYAIPVWVCGFFLTVFVPKLVGALPRVLASPPDVAALLWVLPVALFGALLVMFGRMTLRAGRPLIAPSQGDPNESYVHVEPGIFGAQYVVPGPPTSTAAAVNFGREEVELFAANRRAFTFANDTVAAQFATLNADLVWDPASPVAARSRRLTRVILVLVIAAGVIVLVVDVVRG